jgi:hypothetical protein
VATGSDRASLPLSGEGRCVALHTWQRLAAGGDGVYMNDLVGIECGPTVVTAVDLGKGAGRARRCPKCLQPHPLDEARLDAAVGWPAHCGLLVRVNPSSEDGHRTSTQGTGRPRAAGSHELLDHNTGHARPAP